MTFWLRVHLSSRATVRLIFLQRIYQHLKGRMQLNLLSSVLHPWRRTLLFLMTSWLVKMYSFFISTPQKKSWIQHLCILGCSDTASALLGVSLLFFFFFRRGIQSSCVWPWNPSEKSLACTVVSECFQWPQSEGSHAQRHLGWIVEHKLCVNKWYSANHWVIHCNETTMNWHYCTWCHCRGKTFIQGSVTPPALQNRFLTSGTISA